MVFASQMFVRSSGIKAASFGGPQIHLLRVQKEVLEAQSVESIKEVYLLHKLGFHGSSGQYEFK